MKNLRKILVLTCFVGMGTLMISDYSSQANSNASGAPMGKTGSPGDNSNCSGCHTGSSVSTILGLITSDIPSSGYVPGNTYTISATASGSGTNKFGFQISPQNTSGALKGTLLLNNTSATKLIGSGKYITHTSGGTAANGTNSRTWTFSWTAPAAGSGMVTFYGAFVLANASNSSSGDKVRLSSLAVQENLSIGIADVVGQEESLTIYPNPVADYIIINSEMNDVADILIMDMTGKLIKKIEKYEFGNDQHVDMDDLQRGAYIVNIRTKSNTITRKIIKN